MVRSVIARRGVRRGLVMLACVAGIPAAAYAQASITGVVRDTSGAVLPGVTVEAASPALIEQVRVAVTDGTGRYAIANLRPGAYSVTFTLPGFTTFERDGIQLSGTAIATVDGDLSVGALEETVTVTGEAPTVDVQSTVRQRVLDREVLELLPSGAGASRLAALTSNVTPGRQDVGGSVGDGSARGSLRSRGVVDSRLLLAGVSVQTGTGTTHGVYNIGAYEEVLIDTGAVNTDYYTGGVRVNFIPRDGGNTFSGTVLAAYADDSFAGDNITPELEAKGITSNTLEQFVDFMPTFGGPILQDRLWFHTAARFNRAWNFVPSRFNLNAGNADVWTYEPGDPASNRNTIKDVNTRLTWQANAKNKLAMTYDRSQLCDCPRSLTSRRAPEANVGNYADQPRTNFSLEWTAPVSSRLLLEANFIHVDQNINRRQINPYFAPSPVPLIEVEDQGLGRFRYRGTANSQRSHDIPNQSRVVMSYVTGAHSLRVGLNIGRWSQERPFRIADSPLRYRFRNGVPNRITLFDLPYNNLVHGHEHAVFAQERWTVRRLTVDVGFRYDNLQLIFPEQSVGPGAFSPNRNITFPETSPLKWHDMQPRTGVAYDVFGDGRTALKAGLNRYLAGAGSGGLFGIGMSPANGLTTTTNRSWRDANQDYVPDCDLTNPAANGECGRFSNRNFGTAVPGRAFDPDILEGWHMRDYNWQVSVGVQHEVVPRVSVGVEYWRTTFGNQVVTDHQAYSPADFDEFSITAPADPRLPGGGGYVVPGLFDVKPEVFGRAPDGLVTVAENFGKQTDVWNGVDVTFNARPGDGTLLQGGVTTERRSTNNCEVARLAGAPPPRRGGGLGPYNPAGFDPDEGALLGNFCDLNGTFLTQLKFLAAVTIPVIDVSVSASVQNLPGPQILAIYSASNADVAASLGRRLSGRARDVDVNLIEPRSQYGDRVNQVDVRIGKILRFAGARANLGFDIYNLFNTSAVLAQNPTFGRRWQDPETILNARFAKVILQFQF